MSKGNPLSLNTINYPLFNKFLVKQQYLLPNKGPLLTTVTHRAGWRYDNTGLLGVVKRSFGPKGPRTG